MVAARKKTRFRFGFSGILLLVVLYVGVVIGYYHLPWSIRKPIYSIAPSFDNAMREQGFEILQNWDELALTGRDAAVGFEHSLRADFAYAGLPVQTATDRFGQATILENRGYIAGYSDAMKDPLWVAYRIFDVPKLVSGKRPSRFSVDRRTDARVNHDDYTHSGFDRGHMAPSYGIATRYGDQAQKETFLMSNIVPQTPRINQHIWKDLESRVASRYGLYLQEVWVVTGPIFDDNPARLESGVAIPSAYYKIIVDESGDELRALAFMVPADCPPYARIRSCLVSIDRIEELADIDFFPALPDDMEATLESRAAGRLWPWILQSITYR